VISLLFLLLLAASLPAQTTLGTIRGRVLSLLDGAPPASATSIECFNDSGTALPKAAADQDGFYSFFLLPPGVYRLRVTAGSYQPVEVHNLTVPVAGVVEQNFRLRPLSDVFEQKSPLWVGESRSIVRFHGPDLDFSRMSFLRAWEAGVHIFEPSLSNVIEPLPIRELPLAGRDSYTMLVTQPGVTADAGTLRSLGLSASGQRPASSNFLLDGLELNNSLIAGPLISVPPEALEQYRISVAGYSAEFGRTAGFLANAITRAGTPHWHGLAYHYLRNESLNANDFQNNLRALSRPRQREQLSGYQIGGPLRSSLRVSSAFERLSSAGAEAAQDYLVPGEGFSRFIQRLPRPRQLLERFPAPASNSIAGEPFAGVARLSRPVTLRRSVGVQRLDGAWRQRYRMMTRLLTSRLSWPDFIWSPYPGFVSGLSQNTTAAAITAVATLPANSALEVRVGAHGYNFGWDRAHPEIPTLTISSGNPGARQPLLPSSPAAYSFRNRVRGNELTANLMLWRGRHVLKMGGTLLFRTVNDHLPYAEAGRYDFPSLADFANTSRITFFTSLDRTSLDRGSYVLPDLRRDYGHRQASAFLQDSLRISSRAIVNLGLRMDHLGSPTYRSDSNSQVLLLGQGATLAGRLANAKVTDTSLSSHPVYRASTADLAVRLGFAYSFSGDSSLRSRPVLKAGYGVYFDQAFDNLWLNVRNNSFVFPSSGFEIPDGTDYLRPPREALAQLSLSSPLTDFPSLTAFDPNLTAGAVHHSFVGLQLHTPSGLLLDVNAAGAWGRGLITTDTINRQFSLSAAQPAPAGCDETKYQPCLPEIAYRAAQGASSYQALTGQLSYRSAHTLISASYTLSRSRDNQSDPLRGDFFDLSFTPALVKPGFARQFDAAADSGYSDFDQRHNFVIYSVWNLPGSRRLRWLTTGWHISQVAAARSGFPFSVTDAIDIPATGGTLLVRRADLLAGQGRLPVPVAVPGGLRLLDRSAFCSPGLCAADRSVQGNTARNAFRGPGLYNLDVSLSRTLALRLPGEGTRLTLRADAFNLLNHANLNQPAQDLTAPASFGVASFGRQLRDIGMPSLLPLRETSRQVQLMLRLEF